jgi:hypothetical protein
MCVTAVTVVKQTCDQIVELISLLFQMLSRFQSAIKAANCKHKWGLARIKIKAVKLTTFL